MHCYGVIYMTVSKIGFASQAFLIEDEPATLYILRAGLSQQEI